MKKIKILNYAVNGLGLGHITRLIAINRWIRRITGSLGINAEIFFLTSSECDTIAYHNGFSAFKIPSKNSLRDSGISAASYRRIAKQWVWNSVNMINPDILIVDTFPFGSFNELFDVMDLGFKKVFVYRAVREILAEGTNFQKALMGYDKIITPVEHGLNDYSVPDMLADRIFKTGEIISRNIDELYQKNEALELLGLPQEKTICYVTFGGGGDGKAEYFWKELTHLLQEYENIEFVLGAGPLYKGKEFRGKNLHWFYRYNAIEYYNAFDFAISSGGYNSVHELLYTNIPSILFPLERSFDDQERRINNLVDSNLALKVSTFDLSGLRAKIDIMLNSDYRNEIKFRLMNNFNVNYAYNAAEQILKDFLTEDEMDHIQSQIPGTFFYSLKNAGIPETVGLRAIRILDMNYHEFQKMQNSLDTLSSYFDLMPEFRTELSSLNERLYVDFMEYPLHNIALGFLKYIKSKEIELNTGLKYLENYLIKNFKPPKNIQDSVFESINYINLLLNRTENINDLLSQYIFEATIKR